MAPQRNNPGPLTHKERADALADLTEDQLANMMAYVSGYYPAVFDEMLAIRHPEQMPERLRGETSSKEASS